MKIPAFVSIFLCFLGSLNLQAQPFQITADATQGCDSLLVNFSYTPSITATTALWDFGDGTTSTSTAASVTKMYKRSGSFTVSLTLDGTPSTNTLSIQVGKTPNQDSLNLKITIRDTFQLGPNYRSITVSHNNNYVLPYTYQWLVDDVPTDNTKGFVFSFDSAWIYRIKLVMTDQVGCNATFKDSLNLLNTIEVPNVFTPNDDNINDLFIVKSNGQNVLSLKIFTRTGLLIYKTEANTIVWDGRLVSGDRVLAGLYYYVVETVNAKPPIRKSGFFYIYR